MAASEERILKLWLWSAERTALRGGLFTRRLVMSILGRRRGAAPLAVWAGQPLQPMETVMVGDSIVRRFPEELLAGLSDQPFINHGWGGDTIEDVTRRIKASTSRSPQRLIFQVGTNDLLQGHSVAGAAEAFAALVTATAVALPDSEIGICALPPIARWRVRPSAVHELNQRLHEIAESIHGRYIDVYDPLRAPTGTPLPGITTDGVHLTHTAYVTYAMRLRPIFDAARNDPR